MMTPTKAFPCDAVAVSHRSDFCMYEKVMLVETNKNVIVILMLTKFGCNSFYFKFIVRKSD